MLTTPGYSVADLPDLHGRVALVTGANTGVGLEVAHHLARANATVVLACRDTLKCERAASQVRAGSRAAVSALHLDLNDLRSVADAAAAFKRQHHRSLHILVLNAGVATQLPTALTTDGVERTFQVAQLYIIDQLGSI